MHKCAAGIIALLTFSITSDAGNVQAPNIVLPSNAASNANAVKQAFTNAYAVYQAHAFGHDDLQPVSLTFNDGRNGFGATIVDAMSTMTVMGLTDLYNQAVNFTSTINFNVDNNPTETVSVFESTIRYVGGLISAFQLNQVLNQRTDQVLVDKARELADKLAFAWVGTNQVPFGELNFTTNQPVLQTSNIAEAGTLSLEWTLLSQLTGNQTYQRLVQESVKRIASNPDPLPGLAAQGIDPSTGLPVGSYVTWGGGSDSYFEYLIKFARLFPDSDPIFATTWLTAVESSISTLLRTSTVGNHVYLADFDGADIRHIGSHLACFTAGNWVLGGRLLDNDTIVNIGLELADACWNTYSSDATGIGPESFAFISSDGNFTGGNPPSAADLAFYNRHGFYITSSDYILRPEVLESNFYAYRATGDVKYQQRAQAALASFNKVLAVNGAYAGINDVNNRNGGGFIDDTESFFFAEVLKYLFLTFDDPERISLDKFVFNTEAHPFPAPSASINVNTPTVATPRVAFPASEAPLPVFSYSPFLPKQIIDVMGLPHLPHP